jgi:hypothetical protein
MSDEKRDSTGVAFIRCPEGVNKDDNFLVILPRILTTLKYSAIN